MRKKRGLEKWGSSINAHHKVSLPPFSILLQTYISWHLGQVFRSCTMRRYSKQRVLIWPFISEGMETLLEPLGFDYSSTRSSPVIMVYVGRMKDAPWTCQGKGGRSLVGAGWDSRSLKAEHMASNREQVLLNRLGYLLFSAPWGFKNAAPWLNNGNCYVARLSQ